MTKAEAVKEFKNICDDLYIKRVDYWTAQLAWSNYVDCLNRNGDITDRQRNTWSTPFPYGKNLKPSREQLERKIYGWED